MGRHEAADLPPIKNFYTDVCNICQNARSRHFDDFYGYLCTLCWIKHPLRRTTHPYSGRPLRVVKTVTNGQVYWLYQK